MPSTYTPIATTTLGSAAASVTFSSISGSYTDLVLVISGRLDSGSGQDASVLLQYNNDTSTNYSTTLIDGNGTSAGSARATNATAAYCGSTSQESSNSIVNIMNYSNTTTYKTLTSRGNNPNYRVRAFASLWRSTAAISTIKVISDFAGNFAAGSTFTLYGVKSA